MPEGSIYRDLLGADFDRLGPVLQHVHGPAPLVRATGIVEVKHGQGWLVRFANRMMAVPPAQEKANLRLEVRKNSEHETWIRDFGGKKPLVTEQWAENGLFIEAVGKIKMGMRLSFSNGILRFEPVFTKMFGIPIPKFLGVHVYAEVREQENGWTVLVETSSGMLGLLFRYSGMIVLQP
jgi:hypothetical protein